MNYIVYFYPIRKITNDSKFDAFHRPLFTTIAREFSSCGCWCVGVCLHAFSHPWTTTTTGDVNLFPDSFQSTTDPAYVPPPFLCPPR